MKKNILYILLLIFASATTYGQELYIKTFGNKTDKANFFYTVVQVIMQLVLKVPQLGNCQKKVFML
jgi:hypothetical protein